MTRDMTAGAVAVVTEGLTEDANYGVTMTYNIHLICTGVMTPWCRYDAVTLSSSHQNASVIESRPPHRTHNHLAGQPNAATVAACCHPDTVATQPANPQVSRRCHRCARNDGARR
jgi:hypothetical protein